ncbi:MAG TPA: hypothetical protein VF511_08795 [Chthoniobacterales bacterium]|jgi:hypothetical protein
MPPKRDRLLVRPALFRGVQMRSRAEARAAEWFESLGWDWIYEPESLVSVPNVRYTPDFYLPSIDTLVEIKPLLFLYELTEEKRRVIAKLRKQFALIAPAHANTFAVADFYGHLEGCDPWLREGDDAWGWHSEAPDCDQRTIYVDDGDGRFPRNYIYMGAGCALRHKFGRDCPCTN